MIVVAGPPGSGKSSRFPLSAFGIDWFNADDRAAELNLGSFIRVYDNSGRGGRIKQILSFRRDRPRSIADEIPTWIESLLRGTKFEIAKLREYLTFSTTERSTKRE